jgi:D-aminopeptidase
VILPVVPCAAPRGAVRRRHGTSVGAGGPRSALHHRVLHRARYDGSRGGALSRLLDLSDGWWTLPRGPRNTITDVAGVKVGHADVRGDGVRTGVTAIVPHEGDLFREKLPAGAAVLNGFGKSVGLMQLEELGQIETPILLTNTLCAGTCATALIRRAIAANPEIGRKTSTVNPLVFECNDGTLNDIQALAVTEADAVAALDAAGVDFARGSIGAGSGMRTFGYAGGIGSASRIVRLSGGATFTLGCLVLSNFGRRDQLRIKGRLHAGGASEGDKGSIIVIYATDAPLDARQLARLARRAAPALGRLGSFLGHGSGDVALAVSTAQRLRHDETADVVAFQVLNESRLDTLFLAAVESAEEAVLDALAHGEAAIGRDGNMVDSLRAMLGSN